MKNIFLLIIGISALAVACQSIKKRKADAIRVNPTTSTAKVATQAERILAKTIAAHGGTLYETAHYQFTFRDKKYTFKNENGQYYYSVKSEKEGQVIFDKLDNTGFQRTVNGQTINLTPKDISKYETALNSVIYFATLPHKLQDEAVNVEYVGMNTIKNQTYQVLKVYFNEAGGGKDHDDEFRYWINQSTNRIDYLAYNYHVNEGGVRFRSAYNPRVVEGILFQDYVNYKAPYGTPLSELPAIFEKGDLKKLSVIETEEVIRKSY